MKVNLKIKNEEENSVKTEQFEVEEVSLFQVTRAIKVIKDIVSLTKEDEDLKALLAQFFDDAQSDIAESDEDEAGNKILEHATGALDVLLMEVPDKAIELLSALSGVGLDTLMQQKLDDAFDVYDAIIQVNDIDKLIQRAKKSFALTKSQTRIMNHFKSKETEKPKQVTKTTQA
ncbi:MAG TPA: hypothetical protein VK094_00370 [Pseudogracilibacillus sp.]|nr:hypothetical protein [Pseudogracilibacillus sp.]